MLKRLALSIISLLALSLSASQVKAQTVIPLIGESDGRYAVEASVNGVGVKTYYTSETWFASMSSTTYLFLYENGYIADADVKGMTVVKMPDGSSTKAASFVIKNLRMGNVIVQNLPAFVVKKQSVPLLIGSSAFDEFGEVVQENDRLIINDGTKEVAVEQGNLPDPVDSLKQLAQSLLDEEEYAPAAEVFSKLHQSGDLNMFSEYQYITVLNILGRSDETISLASGWLAAYKGKSLTMEYWLYDSLGDSYARKNNTDKAIENYDIAVQTYCKIFGTTLKDIQKSNFQDESLGYTLYDLGRMYALKKNLRNAEYYCSLAAKCGNPAAKQFCDTYKVKY